MLMPSWRGVPALRHGTLLGFCCITYAFAPVAGFGWALLVMGAAQTDRHQAWLRRLYVMVFALVLFYSQAPWTSALLDIVE